MMKTIIQIGLCLFFMASVNLQAVESYTVESNIPIQWRPGCTGEWDGADFSGLIQAEWLQEDKIDGTSASYRQAAIKHLSAAKELLEILADDFEPELKDKEKAALESADKELAGLSDESDRATVERVYARIRGIKRRIAFANPLLDFGKMLFCKQAPGNYNLCMQQYFGWHARPGGGICVLEEPGRSLAYHNILDGQLPVGSFLEPRLSWDAKKIIFSYVDLSAGKNYGPLTVSNSDPDTEAFYHLYEANIDGTGLKQLTKGSFDDLTPCWLPDGDVMFTSTRRRSNGRCHGWPIGNRWNTYTMHRLNPESGKITLLSYNDTNEWFPEVTSDGLVAYARWDYIDRDSVSHQNMWSMRPDGTNPAALWGNATPEPLCTFQARQIPNSGKLVFTASAHHSLTGGTLVKLDPRKGIDGQQSLEIITPEVPFPEVNGFDHIGYYASPFPLSEDFYLTSYANSRLRQESEPPTPVNDLGIYLVDVFGNREPIYRDRNISSLCACPITPQEQPPVLASTLPPEDEAPDYGVMSVTDVYEGLGDGIARGDIKELRIVQILPKTTRDFPAVGLAWSENARAVLGTVPVESDGSAYFRVPARKAFYFQAIDQQGRAYQTMRSLTYLQPGEKISCTGCHEARDSSGYRPFEIPEGQVGSTLTKALSRAPSEIDPGALGGRPFSYVETVQPIWDRHCLECHNDQRTEGGINLSGEPQDRNFKNGMLVFQEGVHQLQNPAPADIFTKSYWALCQDVIFIGDDGSNPEKVANAYIPRFGARNTIQVTEPGGRYGSIGSRLMKLLDAGHEGVVLSDDERRLICTWIDLNGVFYGVYEPEMQKRQLAGEIVPMPEIQ